MRFFLGIGLLLTMSCLAQATHCSTVVSASYAHAQAVIVAVPVTADYYYSVGGNDQKIAEEVVRRLEARFSFPATGQGQVTQKKIGRESFRVVSRKGSSSDTPSPAHVLSLLNQHCVQCHKPGASKPGNIPLFTADRQLFVDADPVRESSRRERVYNSVLSGDMPKGGRPLSSSEKAILLAWVQQVRKK